MKQTILKFGTLAVALFVLVQLSELSIFRVERSNSFLVILFAVLFIGFGIIISRFVFKLKKSGQNHEHVINEKKIEQLRISPREYDVLKLISLGHSNLEIANELYISESTVKTHVSNLLSKLNVKRRTQAIKKAKELNILS